ncbi:MAG: ABC-F family ATP-binding cassette domain-containing protein, partial [Anaerolineae bacterium]|nr:ABC-F family ATP-binding cassette domain-containing protein [Anaerolineae bacterium]
GELRRLEALMADPRERDEVMERYGELQARFELLGGYEYPHKIEQVLLGVGFSHEEFSMPLRLLSGGQKTRALLARLLLQQPDLLLLDEPTNHLDLASIEWLEEHLAQWPGTFIVVAHDRFFLDKVATRVWELSFGRVETYRGNYSQYLEQRAQRYEQRMAEYQAQQEEIERLEDYIRRYKASERTRQARAREHRLAHMERLDRPERLRAMSLRLQTDLRSGDLVLVSEGMTVGYRGGESARDKALFASPAFVLRRGEKVAILGPNGSGKTTLLRTILGEIPPLAGGFQVGANVKMGYFAQGHADLNEDKTVLDELLDVRNVPLQEARNLLGRFLFSGDDVFKKVGDLSGGERARLKLAKLTLVDANFLLLDEPTSHLDVLSREVLEDVLLNFAGTLIVVTHDRYFISALATQIWVLDGERMRVYPFGYTEYLEARERERKQAKERPSTAPPPRRIRRPDGSAQARKMAERAQQIEQEIQALEARLKDLEEEIVRASEAQDVQAVSRLGEEYREVEDALRRRLEEWTTTAAQL